MLVRLRRDVHEMMTELRDYRELFYMMTRRDILLRYRQTVMGFGWAVFMPVINTIVFSLIFKKVAKIETDVPYPVLPTAGCCRGTCSRPLSRRRQLSLKQQGAAHQGRTFHAKCSRSRRCWSASWILLSASAFLPC